MTQGVGSTVGAAPSIPDATEVEKKGPKKGDPKLDILDSIFEERDASLVEHPRRSRSGRRRKGKGKGKGRRRRGGRDDWEDDDKREDKWVKDSWEKDDKWSGGNDAGWEEGDDVEGGEEWKQDGDEVVAPWKRSRSNEDGPDQEHQWSSGPTGEQTWGSELGPQGGQAVTDDQNLPESAQV